MEIEMRKIGYLFIIGLLFSLYAEMTQKDLEDAYSNSFKFETSQKYDKAISALSKVIKIIRPDIQSITGSGGCTICPETTPMQ
jgi:hypothetical protein